MNKLLIPVSSLSFNEKGIALVHIDGRSICITQYGGRYFAFAERCPHASASLEHGFVDVKGNIVCPVHNYRFSLKHGRDSGCEGYRLRTYPIELKEDGLWIEL